MNELRAQRQRRRNPLTPLGFVVVMGLLMIFAYVVGQVGGRL